jgi:hypothetical protein
MGTQWDFAVFSTVIRDGKEEKDEALHLSRLGAKALNKQSSERKGREAA